MGKQKKQPAPPTLRRISDALTLAFRSPTHGWGRTKWTRRIQRCIRKLYPGPDRRLCAKSCRGARKEYMVDVVVAEECRVRGKEVVHKVLFGCEVEWNPQMKEQLSDFQKLAVIRASRKAFVCGANGSWEAIAGRVKDFDLFWKKHKQVLPGESIAVVVCAYSKEARKVARSHAWILTKEKRKSQLAFPK